MVASLYALLYGMTSRHQLPTNTAPAATIDIGATVYSPDARHQQGDIINMTRSLDACSARNPFGNESSIIGIYVERAVFTCTGGLV